MRKISHTEPTIECCPVLTRMFPETLMPLVAMLDVYRALAYHCVYPSSKGKEWNRAYHSPCAGSAYPKEVQPK